MKAHEMELDIGWGRLAARVWGPPDGVPVLGLHGWQDNAATWDLLAPSLAGVRLVSLDLPGHGRSSWRGVGQGYLFVDYIRDAFAAADAAGFERFALLGHSMGAGIASLMAGTCPERIRAAVFVEGLGPLSTAAEQTPAHLEQAIGQMRSGAKKPGRVLPDLEAAAARRQAAGALSIEGARVLVGRGTTSVDGGVRFRHDPSLRLLSALRFTEEQVLAFLQRVTCPSLLIRARDGWKFDPEMMKERVKCLADTTLLEVEGQHHVHLDDPQCLAEQVARFLVQSPA